MLTTQAAIAEVKQIGRFLGSKDGRGMIADKMLDDKGNAAHGVLVYALKEILHVAHANGIKVGGNFGLIQAAVQGMYLETDGNMREPLVSVLNAVSTLRD